VVGINSNVGHILKKYLEMEHIPTVVDPNGGVIESSQVSSISEHKSVFVACSVG
jgi:hypothetical protein